ncbi:MAG: ABC transporter permease [Streptosporangiales bacterium]|nr:ABC transporter permease [Streptosporangiales bacterium]
MTIATGIRLTDTEDTLRSSAPHTFVALLARDLRVLRQDAASFAVRIGLQPVILLFLFTYVLPKIGTGSALSANGSSATFSTILVPGLVASSVLMAGLMAVSQPLMIELSYTNEIEDRLLAPLPTWMFGLQKIVSGALQALIGGAIVFPIAIVLHAPGQAPLLQVESWPLLAIVVLFGSLFSASLGLLAGTVVDPRKTGVLLTVLVMPATLLGCVFYPWSALAPLRWLQILTLFNPLAYFSEGLRASLTSQVPHLPTGSFLTALIVGSAATAAFSVFAFTRKVIS